MINTPMRKVDHITPEQRAKNTERLRKWRESKGQAYLDSLAKTARERYRSDPEYRQKHKEAVERYQKDNRSRPHGTHISAATWRKMLDENPSCEYCRKPFTAQRKPECDHRIPEIRGGNSLKPNLAVVCRTCNARKHDMTEAEFRRKYGY